MNTSSTDCCLLYQNVHACLNKKDDDTVCLRIGINEGGRVLVKQRKFRVSVPSSPLACVLIYSAAAAAAAAGRRQHLVFTPSRRASCCNESVGGSTSPPATAAAAAEAHPAPASAAAADCDALVLAVKPAR